MSNPSPKLNYLSHIVSDSNHPSGNSQSESAEAMVPPVSDLLCGTRNSTQKKRSYKLFKVETVLKELEMWAEYSSQHGGFIRTACFRSDQCAVGELIGTPKHNGHLRVKIFRADFFIHSLVWAKEYGCWPEYQLDHIDGNPQNNRITNLRDVPQRMNARNARMRKDNTTGYTGVCLDKRSGKYMAYVKYNGRMRGCGYHATAELAAKAREQFILAHPELGYTRRHGQ